LSVRDLVGLLREDWETHERSFVEAGLHAVLVQRLGAWRHGVRSPLGRGAAAIAYKLLNRFIRNVYSIELYDTTRMGRRVKIWHPGSIVIGNHVTIGDGCLIRQNVTIGLVEADGRSPRLGRNVHLSTGVVILGDVTVGDGARIGPNALVLVDVAPGATVFVPPAKQLKSPTGSGSRVDRTDNVNG
jgi:serine O-acetyltransferase